MCQKETHTKWSGGEEVALPFFLKHEVDDGKLETPTAPPLVVIF